MDSLLQINRLKCVSIWKILACKLKILACKSNPIHLQKHGKPLFRCPTILTVTLSLTTQTWVKCFFFQWQKSDNIHNRKITASLERKKKRRWKITKHIRTPNKHSLFANTLNEYDDCFASIYCISGNHFSKSLN